MSHHDYLGPAFEHAMERMAEEATERDHVWTMGWSEGIEATADEHATMRGALRAIAGFRRWRTAGGVLVTSAAVVKIAQGALMDIGEAVDFGDGGAA